MLIEGLVKFFLTKKKQNIGGVSQEKDIAVIPKTV